MKRTRTLDLPYVPLSAPIVAPNRPLHVLTDRRCQCCIWLRTEHHFCWLAEAGQKPPQWETEETCPYQEALLPKLAAAAKESENASVGNCLCVGSDDCAKCALVTGSLLYERGILDE